MNKGRKKIRVVYSSTNEKELKDVIANLIRVRQRKYGEVWTANRRS